jgi:Leucine-rich repeat (LRR) protein
MRRAVYLAALVWLVVGSARGWTDEVESREKALAAIQREGVEIERAETAPGNPVVSIVFGSAAEATDADLAHLKSFPELQNLAIVSRGVTDAGLVHLQGLTKLRSLYFGLCAITDKGLEPLKKLTRLEEVTLRNTKVTEAGNRALEKALPRLCARLEQEALALLRKKNIQIEIDESQSGQRTAKLLFSCHAKEFTDRDLAYLKYLPPMEYLFLYGNITDAGLRELKELTNLKSLVLKSNGTTTDAGIQDLQKALPKLKIDTRP